MKTTPKQLTAFQTAVFSVVKNIPHGQTMSYDQVARQAGFPKAARAVGSLMKTNFDPNIPCHRVIRSDGNIGQYNRGGPAAKHALLEAEKANR